jgi:hypothetical protein
MLTAQERATIFTDRKTSTELNSSAIKYTRSEAELKSFPVK